MEHHKVIIVGAGASGRIAKLICPDACIIEAAQKDNHRSAAMVGVNYLHEDIPELDTRKIKVYTGHKGDWNSDVSKAGNLQKITGPDMAKYQNKCRGTSLSSEQAEMHTIDRGDRYTFEKESYAYDLPDFEDIVWDAPVVSVSPRDHVVTILRGAESVEMTYDMLVWTAPFHAMYQATGNDPRTLGLEGVPIYYHSMVRENVGQLFDDEHIIVEYVPDPTTAIYRRTIYHHANGLVETSIESLNDFDGALKFWPGKVKLNEKVMAQEQMLRDHDIVLAGRFARWDPDELTHHTAQRLREALK